MSDTQWPRFQVFLQEKLGTAHMDVGSVHAPDAEMALFNARDVFVRRPDCTSLWVVPAGAIFSKTREELEVWQADPEDLSGKSEEEYHAFCKAKAAGMHTFAGTLKAASPAQALGRALEEFRQEPPPFVWWVFPARLVMQSSPEDIESHFAPASEKTFRLATDFRTHSSMRQIKKGKKQT
jgi:ring-1,2-phenylacetyl-CoA epoxidase subunit PaaB